MSGIFDSKEYKTSRHAYSAQCMFEYFIALLASDAFLAKLLKDIGLSDGLTGVLSSLISFLFLFQLLSIPLAGKLKKVKKPIMVFDTLSQLFFAALYTVPFMPLGVTGKAVAATGFIILAYFTLYLNTSICYKWGNSFVSPDRRGSFTATKEMVSLFAGMIFTLFVGMVTDRYESKGNLHGAFAFLSIGMTVVCAFNFLCLSFISDTSLSESSVRQSIPATVRYVFHNRNCRNAMILTVIMEFTRYLTIGFMGTYKTAELGFSVGQIQIMNIAASLGRFVISKPVGRYSDRTSYPKGYLLGNILTLFAFAAGIFVNPERRLLVLIFTMLYQMSFAGTNQNTFNMMYSFADDEYVLSAMSVNSSIRGIFGFIASLVGSRVLTAVQNNGNRAFGRNIYGQQLLSAVSFVLTAAALLFNKFVLIKQSKDYNREKMKTDS